MLKSLGEKVPDMNVIEGIVSDLSVFAILNKVEIAQDAELM